MMTSIQQGDFLGGLPGAVRDAVLRTAEPVALESGACLIKCGQPTRYAHFVESGFLSAAADNGNGSGVEVGLIGREGMVGSWLTLGSSEAPFDVVVRNAGRALRLSAAVFAQACIDHPELRSAALVHCHRFTAMVADTCQAQARLTVEARLARWLLLAHDRIEDDNLPITHDVLSKTLGVRRPGVTVALHVLEGEHMLKSTRGLIQILDREKLERTARAPCRGQVAPQTTAAIA